MDENPTNDYDDRSSSGYGGGSSDDGCGGDGGEDRRVYFDEEPAFTSRHEGGRLWEVTPMKNCIGNDTEKGASLKIRQFGAQGLRRKTSGMRVVGLAPVGDLLSTNKDEFDDMDYEKIDSFTHTKTRYGRCGSGNSETEERENFDSRDPSVTVDRLAIDEVRDDGTGERRRCKTKGDSHRASQDGDSATLSHSNDEQRKEFRMISIVTCVVLFVLFLILVVFPLCYLLREDDNNVADDRGTITVIFDTPTVSPLFDSITMSPTHFPTFSANRWETAGDAIPHDNSSGQVAVALSFDGRTMVTLQGDKLRRYQWQDLAWRERGSVVRTTTWNDQTTVPSLAVSINGDVVTWGNADTRNIHALYWDLGAWRKRPVISLLSLNGDVSSRGEDLTLTVSASGNVLAVGEPLSQESSSGRVHLFRWSGIDQQWTRIRTWTGRRGSLFGSSVSLSLDGKTLAIAAAENDFATITPGMVRVYRLEEGTDITEEVWAQIGQTLVGTRDEDRFGAAVALSGSAQHLAIGAPANDDRSGLKNNSGKSNAGQVRVFQWDENVGLWVAYGQSLKGTRVDQNIGEVVSLSNDGQILATAGLQGGLMIYRLNSVGQWILRGLSTVSAPKTVSSAALSGSGKVVAVSDSRTDTVHAFQSVP